MVTAFAILAMFHEEYSLGMRCDCWCRACWKNVKEAILIRLQFWSHFCTDFDSFLSLPGRFWLIIGTFLSHYPDNLPDKRNREFANAPCHTSMPSDQITVVDQITGGLRGGGGGAIIDPTIAIRVMLAPIFQCHLEQLKPIRMLVPQGSSLQKHLAFSLNNFFRWIVKTSVLSPVTWQWYVWEARCKILKLSPNTTLP